MSKSEVANTGAAQETDWAERWADEFSAAKEHVKKWHDDGKKVVKQFLGKGSREGSDVRLNLFHSNVTTLRSMLYGRLPQVEVDRRYSDQDDDVARVGGEILQRMLNYDIEEAGEDYASVLRSALDDRLLPGMGSARVRYHAEYGKEQVPPKLGPAGEELAPGFEREIITYECVETLYVHWKDLLWSPCRTWKELRWVAFRNYMTKEELEERFGKDVASRVPLNSKGKLERSGLKKKDVYDQAEVWEIWHEETKKVFWYVDGHDEMLDEKEDILGLDGFFPMPPSMFANLTTTELIARSDYAIAQDLYAEIDQIETRISILTRACKVVGAYDKKNKEIATMLDPGMENKLIPVENWAQIKEGGGLEGQIDWIPLEQIVQTIDVLSAKLTEKIQLLYQVTGMAEILRGGDALAGASATEQALKAKFASIRVQALQDEFARFATDLQKLKREIITKHFQPKTILECSNASSFIPADQQLIPEAIQLIKDPNQVSWRINVRPESLAMVDYAQLKQDRTEYITALSLFMQSAAPILETFPEGLPFLLELLKWGLAGFKGSNQIEGVVDQAIAQLEKQPPGGKPDPQVQKMQMEMQRDQQKFQMEMQQDAQKHQAEMMKIQAELFAKLQETQAKLKADMVTEIIQMLADVQATKVKSAAAHESAEDQIRVAKETAKTKPKKDA